MRATLAILLLTGPALAAPPEVVIIKPVEREVFDHADVTGRIEASTTVEMRSRLTGQLVKVHFKDGTAVKKGEILFEFDDRFQRAEVERSQAEYRRAEARLKVAELDYGRLVKLGEAKSVSQDEVQRSAAALEEAKATLLAARAALDVAKINLEFTRIKSPIDGRIGRALMSARNLVQGAETLATVYSLDPLSVIFDLDERTMLRLIRYTRDRGDEKTAVRLSLTGDETFSRQAAVDFLDPALDPKAGTLRVRAVLSNAKEDVRPGQAARVRVQLGDPRKALLLPEQAIDGARFDGHWVLIVNDKNVLEERRIGIGLVADGLVEITTGVKVGDRVVGNPVRLRAGQEVKPQPFPGPADKPGGLGAGIPPARPLPDLPGAGPALVVSATHPGASAHVVAETVAAPIDQQINGMEKLTHRVLGCSDDGTMRLTLLFQSGTDLNKAQVLAQNRIAVALPQLPEDVRRVGITVKKRGVPLGAVAVLSPTSQYDRDFLARYAKARLRDDLARVPGVAEVTFYGDTEPGRQVRLVIDREKLARMGLTITALSDALREQGLTASADGGRIPTLALTGRLPDPDQLGRLEVANDKGQKVPLGSVARVEVAEGWGNVTSLDGKPCVLLLVARLPDSDVQAVTRAIRKHVADLAKQAPEGMELKVVGEP